MEKLKGNEAAYPVRIPEVPDFQNVVVNATNAVYYCLAFKCDAFPKILPILCIRIMSASSKYVKRNPITLQTFADEKGSAPFLKYENH